MLNIQRKLTPSFYALLSLPATAMGFGLCIQISALSWILSTKYGLDIEQVGYVWLSGPLAGLIGQPLVGLISDNVWFMGGRRRPFIVIGAVVASLMILCLPELGVISEALGLETIIPAAIAVTLALDLAINISFNPTRAIIADVTPEGEARTKGFTWMQTVSGFFGVLAYLIGAFIGNIELIYTGVFVVLLFSLIPIFLVEEPRVLQQDSPADATVLAEQGGTQTNPAQLIPIYIAHGFTWLGVQTMFVYLYAYAEQKMAVESDDELGFIIGIAFAIMNTVGFLLPAFVLEPLSKRIGRVKVHAACLAVMAVSYFIVIAAGGSMVALFLVMALIGVGWAAVVSLPFAIMTEYVSPQQMGLYMGIFNISIVLPQVVVSGVFGSIFKDAANLDLIFVICGVSLAISAALWLLLVRDKES
ncbi:MAG: MFS transporter [Bacteroidota bacterium]